jgi:P4 family phage/plasmid primase-like protien
VKRIKEIDRLGLNIYDGHPGLPYSHVSEALDEFGKLDTEWDLSTGFYKTENGKTKPDHYLMAEYFKSELHLVSHEGFCEIWTGTHYDIIGTKALSKKIMELSNMQARPTEINDFKTIIMSYTIGEEKNFADNSRKINMANGVLDIRTRVLKPHDPKYHFQYCLPHIYDKTATCPTFHEFLKTVFKNNDGSYDEDTVSVLQKFTGYILLGGDPFLHRALCLIGSGRNGKSTFLDIITELLGTTNCSTVSMSNLNKPFSVVMMQGKMANIDEESSRFNSDVFKALVAGGSVIASYKGVDEFSLRVSARMLFACNDYPIIKDQSIGSVERFLFIPFNQYISPKKRDPKIKDRIISSEMSGVLNWALEGLDALLKSPFIKESYSMLEAKRNYQSESDSVFDWFNEKASIDLDSDEKYGPDDLYRRYERFCITENRNAVGKKAFSRRLCNVIRLKGDEDEVLKVVNGYRVFKKITVKQ